MVALCLTVARAIAADDTDVVIDLSEVTFMDAATIGVMIRAERFCQRVVVFDAAIPLSPPSARPLAWAAWRISSIHGHQAGPR